MPWGRSNWPGPVPGSPQLLSSWPLGAKRWQRVVAVAVGHVDGAISTEVGVGGVVEVAAVGAGEVGVADASQDATLGGGDPDDVGVAVSQPEVLVVVQVDAVGVVEDVVAPGVHDLAVGVEHDHGVGAAAEAVDAAAAVHGHAADPAQKNVGRQLRPALHALVAMRSTSYRHRPALPREPVTRPS